MWQAVATRDWPPTGLTTTQWMDIPPQYVRIATLHATQPHLHTHALTTTPPPTRGPDPLVHIVVWQGVQYIEDGHHRVVRAALKGYALIRARVYEAQDQATTHGQGLSTSEHIPEHARTQGDDTTWHPTHDEPTATEETS